MKIRKLVIPSRQLLFLFVVGIAAVVAPGPGGVPRPKADGAVFHSPVGISNGVSRISVFHLGDSAAPSDSVGDRITFTASASANSSATPLFSNGLNRITVEIKGKPCDEKRDSSRTAEGLTKCFALDFVTSKTPGLVGLTVTSKNQQFSNRVPIAFLPARAVLPVTKDIITEQVISAQNAGSESSVIVFDFYSEDGTNRPDLRYVAREQIPGEVSKFFCSDICNRLPAQFRGIVVIGSDQPTAVTTVVTQAAAPPKRKAAVGNGFAASSGGSGNVVALPYVANQLDRVYNTRYNVVNTSASPVCFTVTYAFVPGVGSVGSGGKPPVTDSGPGGSGCATGYALAPASAMRFAPVVPVGSFIDGATKMPASTVNTLMAATIVATGGTVGVAVEAFTTDATAKAAFYEGFNVGFTGGGARALDVGTELVVPLALKTADGYYTQILVSNSSTADATATIRYRAQGGQVYPVTIRVPANGVANHSVYSDDKVPLGFVGSAIVESDKPLAAVLFRAKKISPTSDVDESLYTAVNAAPSSNGAKELHFPVVSRRAPKARPAGTDGVNSWISVTVAGGGQAKLNIRAVGSCAGETAASVYKSTFTVNGSFVFYQNADRDNALDGNPACFDGGVVITSDVPILGVASWISDLGQGDLEGVYNGMPRH